MSLVTDYEFATGLAEVHEMLKIYQFAMHTSVCVSRGDKRR